MINSSFGGNTHGTCQLMCAEHELATTVVYGVHIGPACMERIREIAIDAGVVLDERIFGAPKQGQQRRVKHMRPPGTRPRRTLVTARVRQCWSCRRLLPVKPGNPPKKCPRCGGPTAGSPESRVPRPA